MDPDRIKALAAQASDMSPVILPMNPSTDLHVDGDYCAYYFSGNDETSLALAKRNMIDALTVAARVAGAGGQVVVHLTAGGSEKGGRYKIATVKEYQAQRGGSKPKNWQGMRDWLEGGKTLAGTKFRVVTWEDREADDGVAAAAYYALSQGRVPAILSRDKDFRMIPGRHVVWTTLDRHEFKAGEFSSKGPDGELYGEAWFWHQMLQGDSADNIPGLEKQPAVKAGEFKACGESCAQLHLAEATTREQAYDVVSQLYAAYYGASWPDRFVEQAALLWLRTDKEAYVGDFMRVIPDTLDIRDLLVAVKKLEKRIRS